MPKKWRQYKERANPHRHKQDQTYTVLTPSQTRQGAEAFFLTFEKAPFSPKTSNKGNGRRKGTTVGRRVRHQVVKNTHDSTKMKLKVEKIE